MCIMESVVLNLKILLFLGFHCHTVTGDSPLSCVQEEFSVCGHLCPIPNLESLICKASWDWWVKQALLVLRFTDSFIALQPFLRGLLIRPRVRPLNVLTVCEGVFPGPPGPVNPQIYTVRNTRDCAVTQSGRRYVCSQRQC